MNLSAEELLQRISRGENLEAISLSLISPAEQGLLRCCAIVRSFNENLVDTCFRPHVPEADRENVPFTRLIEREFVQRVPRTDGDYYLTAAMQKQYYDDWWESSGVPRSEVPKKLREVSISLRDYYLKLGDAAKLDLLAQQIFIDREQACDCFEELYELADDAFDLARSRDIINVVRGRENVLGPTLAKALNDTDRYLQARSRWATEYYQTISYYDRLELNKELESFLATNAQLAPGKKWILHLHAPGGMGKTMFVRWLIARRCIPNEIPCGRIDFDFVDRITASQHRWLLFLQVARELEIQIPGNFFHSFIAKFTDYERIVNHQQVDPVSPMPTSQLPPPEKLEGEMLYLFGNALRDANLTKPTILILDTLEEIILYHPDDLMKLVRHVNDLRETANIVLVLSGRYDLTEPGPDKSTRLPQYNKDFRDFTKTVRVTPFDRTEAIGFLKKRGLTEDRPLDAVFEKTDGNPFKLALFADILLDDPEISTETIHSYPSADLLYLIERVLSRIPNKTLHWLLRYGVVPRKLTLSFVKEVMKKYLVQAISGDATHDDPVRYKVLTASVQKKVQEKIFLRSGGSPESLDLDVDKLWAELQNYASTYAWVTMEPADPYTVGFHADVLHPMRRWIGEEPVYKLLHQDAIAYFEQKAEADPRDWARWQREAVYHKFQLEGADAAEYWRGLMSGEEDPSRRYELAREIIGSEYVDDNLKPLSLGEGRPIIAEATLASAYCELARASVGIARARKLRANDQLWQAADFDLSRCEQLQRDLPTPAVSSAVIGAVRAAILTAQGRAEEAISLVQEELKKSPDERACLRLEGELANAYASRANYAEASRYWRSALEKAEHLKLSPRFIVETKRRLATILRNEYEFEASADELEKALNFVGPDDLNTKSEILTELADLYLEMGQLSRAKQTRPEPERSHDPSRAVNLLRYLHHETNVRLASCDPLGALEINREALSAPSAAYNMVAEESKDLWNTLTIRSQEQQGTIMSVLLEVDHARRALESARSHWREIGNSKATKQCTLKKAELFLTQAGDVREARGMLEEATRLTMDYDREQWLEEQLLRLRIFNLANEQDDLFEGVQKVEQRAVEEDWKPLLRARLLLGTGAWRLSANDRIAATDFFWQLADVLQKIQPSSLRILLLDPLREYPSWNNVDYRIAEKLIALSPLDPDSEDFFVSAPKVAELLRVLGRKDQALALIDHLRKDIKDNSFPARTLMLTRAKLLRTDITTTEIMRFVEALRAEFKEFPTLCGSTIIELLELSQPMRPAPTNMGLLEMAGELLKKESVPTQWRARLLAVRGRMSMAAGRERDAHAELRQAISLFARLGNMLAIDELERFIDHSKQWVESAAFSSAKTPLGGEMFALRKTGVVQTTELTTTIHVRESWTEFVTIDTTYIDETVATRKVPIEPESLLDRLLAFETYENYSFSFLTAMDQNWIETCTGLGQILVDSKQAEKLKDLEQKVKTKPGLRLIIDALQLSSAPWEMMVLPSQSDGPASISPALRSLYRSLVPDPSRDVLEIARVQTALSQISGQSISSDGIFGKQTKEALKKFQREHDCHDHGWLDGRTRRTLKKALQSHAGRERPRVLLLRPGIERQRATSRGHQVFGFSPEDFYRRAGFEDVLVIEDPHVALIEKRLSEYEADVVHIFPTMEESTSIGIYLDFGSRGTGVMPPRNTKSARQTPSDISGDVEFLTLSSLSEMITRQQRPGRMRPLLILDVLEPAGRTELFTQLFLRNAFAAQLYQLDAFESIIATGLTPAEMQEPMCRLLTSAVASFDSVGNIVNQLRRTADLGSYTHLADVGSQRGPLRNPADREYLSMVVATAAIALFTQDPEL